MLLRRSILKVFFTVVWLANLSNSSRAEQIITAGGIFNNCQEAVAFRDGELLSQIDAQFGRYSSGVQDRVEHMSRELWPLRHSMQDAYEGASRERKSAVWKAAARTAFYGLLGKAGGQITKLKAFRNLDEKQKAIVEQVGKRALTLHAQAIEQAQGGELFTGKPASVDSFIKDNLDLVLSVGAPNAAKFVGGPLGTAVILGAEIGIASATAYMEKTLEVNDARVQRDAVDGVLTTIILKSPKETMQRLYQTKAIIDEKCGITGEQDRLKNAARDEISGFGSAMDKYNAEAKQYQDRLEGLETALGSQDDATLNELAKRIEREYSRLRAIEKKQKRTRRKPRRRKAKSSPSQKRRDPRCAKAYEQIRVYRNYMRDNSLPGNVRAQVNRGIQGTQSWINSNC